MLVSHRHRFIYLKGEKVAGTSTEVYLQPACEADDVTTSHTTDMSVSPFGIVGARRNLNGQKKPRFYNHMPADEVKRKLAPKTWNDYLKISNVRNPFSMITSKVLQYSVRDKVEIKDDADFFKCLESYLKDDSSFFSSFMNHCFIDGALILDEAIRFEHLEADLARVCDRIGYVAPTALPTLKQRAKYTDNRKVAEFWPQELADHLVAEIAPYFDAFNYSRDPADA